MIANFALTRLVIRKDDRWNRNVLRILKQGEQYQFNGYGDECGSLERDFFAAGVTISAIVGKNGSGKSSLLDLTYRMFNNLGYCLKRSLKHKPTEPHLGFVPDLYADLDFVVTDPKTDVKTYCCIHNLRIKDTDIFISNVVMHGFTMAHAITAMALVQTVVGYEAALTTLTIITIVPLSKILLSFV